MKALHEDHQPRKSLWTSPSISAEKLTYPQMLTWPITGEGGPHQAPHTKQPEPNRSITSPLDTAVSLVNPRTLFLLGMSVLLLILGEMK